MIFVTISVSLPTKSSDMLLSSSTSVTEKRLNNVIDFLNFNK